MDRSLVGRDCRSVWTVDIWWKCWDGSSRNELVELREYDGWDDDIDDNVGLGVGDGGDEMLKLFIDCGMLIEGADDGWDIWLSTDFLEWTMQINKSKVLYSSQYNLTGVLFKIIFGKKWILTIIFCSSDICFGTGWGFSIFE